MHLSEVLHSNPRDVRDFLQLPFSLYRGVPQWVPPLMPGERARLKPDFPYYEHSEAAFFLVRDAAGNAVGRIAVQNNRPFNEYRGRSDALLYLYESVDDDAVASSLFEAASTWAQGRGLNRLVGPKGFLVGDGMGLLVEGFEYSPALGIPYNVPYYVRQWEKVGGFTKEVDYLSGHVSRREFVLPAKVRELAAKIRERRGFHVPVFQSNREIRRHLPSLQKAYNSAFANLWSYTPIPDHELEAVFNRIFLVAEPHMIKLIFKEDQVIGFQFAYPDISAAIRRQKGEMWPLGWVDFLTEKKRTRWVNVNGNAILPQYQGLGANAILYDEMAKTILDSSRYDYADLVQVQDTNSKMLSDMQAIVPMNIVKRHRIYQKGVLRLRTITSLNT
jgi:hypothetical protein